MPTYWWDKQNAAPLKFDPKPSQAALSAVFANFDKCRSEAAGDVISGVAVDYVGMNVRATFVESGLNNVHIF